MEFKGIGTIPYERPSEELKRFFRLKYKTLFHVLPGKREDGLIYREDMRPIAERIAEQFPLMRRKAVIARNMDEIWAYIYFHGRNKINEKQFIESWLQKSFAEPGRRKMHMEMCKDFIKDSFNLVDLNDDGSIELEELKAWLRVRKINTDKTAVIFNELDANHDGQINTDEWGYGMMMFLFQSGPDNILSQFFGHLPIISLNDKQRSESSLA